MYVCGPVVVEVGSDCKHKQMKAQAIEWHSKECVHACMYLCVSLCTYVCTYMHKESVCVCAFMYMYVCMRTYIRMYLVLRSDSRFAKYPVLL